jgi:hypothetical protein
MIRRRSKKRAAQEREYARIAKEILSQEPICPVTGEIATQIHHMKGRIGDLLTDRRYMLPVSDRGHKKIELNPDWAKEMGYSLSRLAVN